VGRAQSDVATLSKVVKLVTLDTTVSGSSCLTDFSNLVAKSAPSTCTPRNAPRSGLPLCGAALPGYMCWNGPYLTAMNKDPWGNAYTGTEDPVSHEVTVRSNGPDGIP